MFCVLRGRVRGVNRLSDGSEVLVHIGESGSWFAVYGMLANDVSIGSVVADCPVTTLNLPQPQFARIVRDEPSYYPYFARLLIEQFKMVFRYLGEVQGLEPEGWLLLRLRELVAVARRDHPGSPLANEIAVSQANLATMIGVSRQTLNVLLSRLEQRGLVKIKFRRIQVIEQVGSASPAPRQVV
jgi:CRP-like cAMP-binding protein